MTDDAVNPLFGPDGGDGRGDDVDPAGAAGPADPTEAADTTGPVDLAEAAEDAAGPGADPDGVPADVRHDARRSIEAIVLVSEVPIDVNLLGQLLEMRPAIVESLCRELAAEYEQEQRGFQLVRVAGGWRFQSHPDQSPYVERFVLEGQTSKLSNAALETLAIVAYKQPISRAQVASIRGVSVDGVMRTLQQRGYIAEIGRDPGPGQAAMFGTTRTFLEKLGVDSLADLPALGDFVPDADVVEQLEQGLRPDGPTVPERLDALGEARAGADDLAEPAGDGNGNGNDLARGDDLAAPEDASGGDGAHLAGADDLAAPEGAPGGDGASPQPTTDPDGSVAFPGPPAREPHDPDGDE